MGNPLLLLFLARSTHRTTARQRPRVAVPTEVPSTDALFLVLRRMRTPLIAIIIIFAVSVFGLSAIPGVDSSGNPSRLSIFDSFYFISYTATTIGFGEIVPFTTPQRMWVTASIFGTVIGWAYAIGKLLALLQDQGFQEALAMQAFRRKVRRMHEPFFVVAGYGQTGRQVCQELDDVGRRVVVIDPDRLRIERLANDQLTSDAPGIDADASHPGVLGLAGLGHPSCEGVLALTDSDDVNLAIVMTTALLRPEVRVVARCTSRLTEDRMNDFGPFAIINPDDRYGAYLILALQRPSTYRLVSWLMSPPGTPLPSVQDGLAEGRWVVCADGQFADEVTADLRAGGITVDLVPASDGHPDVSGAAGFIAGTGHDMVNLAMAEHARLREPDLFVSVRQQSSANEALLKALDIDSVFTATDLVATESLARVVTPVYWTFIDHALSQPNPWAHGLLDLLVGRCGTGAPERELFTLDRAQAPAVVRWMRTHELTLADLLRDPDDRTRSLSIVPLLLIRSGEADGSGGSPASTDLTLYAPPLETALRPGDQILLAGRGASLAAIDQTLFYDSVVEYVTTGREVPVTWIWRLVASRRIAS